MNIILFGPPGVGKSTLIGVLKRKGIPAIDLEDVYPSKIRFQLPSMVDEVVFGGADLNPSRQYSNAIKVLLLMDQDAYEMRRKFRDAQIPSKAKQAPHRMENWLKNAHYDYVIKMNLRDSPEDTVNSDVFQKLMYDFNMLNRMSKDLP